MLKKLAICAFGLFLASIAKAEIPDIVSDPATREVVEYLDQKVTKNGTDIANLSASMASTSTILGIANGGTGATTAASARTNLGAVGTDGTSATGTWPISITGNANTATTAITATTATNNVLKAGDTMTGPLVVQNNSVSAQTFSAYGSSVTVSSMSYLCLNGAACIDSLPVMATGNEYFLTSTAADVTGYRLFVPTVPAIIPASTTTYTISQEDTLIMSYMTPPGLPGMSLIPDGWWRFRFHASVSNAGPAYWSYKGYTKVYTYLNGIKTFVAQSDYSTGLTVYPEATGRTMDSNIAQITMSTSTRLIVEYWCKAYGTGPAYPTLYVYRDNDYFNSVHFPTVINSGSYVPYQTATNDVDLNGHNLTAVNLTATGNVYGNGSNLTGLIQSTATGTYPLSISGNAATATYASSATDNTKVAKTGDTMTGSLIVSGSNRVSSAYVNSNYFTINNSTVVAATTNGTNLGTWAGLRVPSGAQNTYVGFQAGYGANTSNHNNTAVGYQALYGITSGQYNTTIGAQAGNHITSGYANTLIGPYAGYGAYTGSSNTVMGYFSGSTLLGDNNILIGKQANVASSGQSNYINIGGIYTADMANSSATINGDLHANHYYGDGSNLTNIAAGFMPGSGIFNNGSYGITTTSDVVAHAYYGDGSHLTGIGSSGGGDNLGNHVATMTLTAGYGILASTISTDSLSIYSGGDKKAAIAYQAGQVVESTFANDAVISNTYGSLTIKGLDSTGNVAISKGLSVTNAITTPSSVTAYNVSVSSTVCFPDGSCMSTAAGGSSGPSTPGGKSTTVNQSTGTTITTSDFGKTFVLVSTTATPFSTFTLPTLSDTDIGGYLRIVKFSTNTINVQTATGQYISDSSINGRVYNNTAQTWANIGLQAATTFQWLITGGDGWWVVAR